jgi:hypothetical protein
LAILAIQDISMENGESADVREFKYHPEYLIGVDFTPQKALFFLPGGPPSALILGKWEEFRLTA